MDWLYLAIQSFKSFTWSSPQHLGPPEPAAYAAQVSLLQQVSSHGHTGRELLALATRAIDSPINSIICIYIYIYVYYVYVYLQSYNMYIYI